MAPSDQGQVNDCVVKNIQNFAAGTCQCLVIDIWNDFMGFVLECFPSEGLHGLNFELWERSELSCGPSSEQGQVSDCVDQNIQTIAAGPSQCLIMDILNDVVGFGL